MNQQIRIREVRVIGENGEQLGILPTVQALQAARERELDLVEVAPTASPPVCRIMDYGRFRFLQSKKDREARRIQKPNLLREMRFRPRIATHDREAKIRRVRGFLGEGSKVKLTVMFRGREMSHPEAGVTLLRGVAEGLKEQAKVEAAPAMEGRRMSLILVPIAQQRAKSDGGCSSQGDPCWRRKQRSQSLRPTRQPRPVFTSRAPVSCCA